QGGRGRGRVRQPGHQVHAEADGAPLDVPGHRAADVLPAPADVEPRGQRVGDGLRPRLRLSGLASDRRYLPLLHQLETRWRGRVTCRGKRTPIGEARLFKRVIPSADDARRRVETAWVWISVMEATRGHYRVAAGDRGTVRSASTSEGAEAGRNDQPAPMGR